MNIDIPVIVNSGQYRTNVAALFKPDMSVSDSKQSAALRLIERELEEYIHELRKDDDWAQLEQILYSPLCSVDNYNLKTKVQNTLFDIWLPVVCWNDCAGGCIYCPRLDDFWFRCDSVKDFSTEKLEPYFTQWVRQKMLVYNKDWLVETLGCFNEPKTYSLRLVGVPAPEGLTISREEMLGLVSISVLSGLDELNHIAGLIKWAPNTPQELISDSEFVIEPDNPKILELYRHFLLALTNEKKKGVILVGKESSGRSRAIESVLKTLDRNTNYQRDESGIFRKREIPRHVSWFLSGSRMIAGMSQAGQWEARAEAIFSWCKNNNQILCFNSLLELIETGKSGSGEMSIADCLLNYMKQDEIRVVSALTPTQLKRLRERNRSFAQQFEIMYMPTLNREEQLDIYIREMQKKNLGFYASQSPFESISFLMQIGDWFESEKGTPGNVCNWIEYLSTHESSGIPQTVLSRLGVQMPLLLNRPVPNRQNIEESLSAGVIGQKTAIRTMANACLRFQGLLTDSERPVASLFFLGPTGVGKTESAKQLAKFLYDDENRFLRFDCNELTTSQAVSRLIGSFSQEGTLTSAVRLQPFSVLLFDEVEKADSSFHDLLLQVLGEGRLTDGRGRTVSFNNCLIILTSNLGADKAGRFPGFGSIYQEDESSYLKALKNFFRPELLNRIDAIVPFNRLENNELKIIAQRFINNIQNREGFVRRKTLFRLTPEAMEWLVEQGHDPKYGARQTQRSLEKAFVNPLSKYFAENSWDTMSVIKIDCTENKQLTFSATPLKMPKQNEGICVSSLDLAGMTVAEFLPLQKALFEWIDKTISVLSGQSASHSFDWNNLSSEDYFHIQMIDVLQKIKDDLELNSSEPADDRRLINRMWKLEECKDPDSRSVKASYTLSRREWEQIICSYNGYLPSEAKKMVVSDEHVCRVWNELFECKRWYNFIQEDFPQEEEALVMVFSTATEVSAEDSRIYESIHYCIEDAANGCFCPVQIVQDKTKDLPAGVIGSFIVKGLAAYRVARNVAGVTIQIEKGRLIQANSVVVIPFDSKSQSVESCINQYVNSDAAVWSDVNRMTINGSSCAIESGERWAFPPELETAINAYLLQRRKERKQ